MKGESCHGMTNVCFTFLLLRFEFFFISSRKTEEKGDRSLSYSKVDTPLVNFTRR